VEGRREKGEGRREKKGEEEERGREKEEQVATKGEQRRAYPRCWDKSMKVGFRKSSSTSQKISNMRTIRVLS
jgi:hypothetical protein